MHVAGAILGVPTRPDNFVSIMVVTHLDGSRGDGIWKADGTIVLTQV